MTDPIDQIREAAQGSIDPNLLTGEGLLREPPAHRYLRDDETLHYLFSNRSRGLTAAKLLHRFALRDFTVSDAIKKDPGTNYGALMLVTSKRVVFVVGRAKEDKTFAVEYPDITAVQYQDEGPNRQLSVRNMKLKYTFVPEQRNEIGAAANYIRSRIGEGSVDAPMDNDKPTETATDGDTTTGPTDSKADSESNADQDPEPASESVSLDAATAGEDSTADGAAEPADSHEASTRTEVEPEAPEPGDGLESLPETVTERIDSAIELLDVGDPFESPDETYRAAVEAHVEFCAAIEALPETAEGSDPAEELAEQTDRLENIIDLMAEYSDHVTRAGELVDDGADAPAHKRSSLVSKLTALRGDLSELGISSARVDRLVEQLSDSRGEESPEPDDEPEVRASADGETAESSSEVGDPETGSDVRAEPLTPPTLESLPQNGRLEEKIPIRVDHISSDDDERVTFRGIDANGEEVNVNTRRTVELHEGRWYELENFRVSTRKLNGTQMRYLRSMADPTVVDLGETPPFAVNVDYSPQPERSVTKTGETTPVEEEGEPGGEETEDDEEAGEPEVGTDSEEMGTEASDSGVAAIAEYYDVFYQFKKLIDRLGGGTPHGEESTMVDWHDALDTFLTEGLADWEQGYGPSQGETEASISEYRDRFGTGDRITDFQHIDVAPADPVVYTLLARTNIVSNGSDEPFAVPVSPETVTPLPVFVESDAALEMSRALLDEFPNPATLTSSSDGEEETEEAKGTTEDSSETSEPSSDELHDVADLTDREIEALRAAGYHDCDSLRAASADDLAAVEGLSPTIAWRIKADVGGT